MQRKTLLTIIVSLIAMFALLALHTLDVTSTGAKMGFKTISKGVWSGHTSQSYYVIQDADEWARVWNEHQQIFTPQRSPPDIDFSEATVIAVFMGQCPTTGYSIEVREVIDTGLAVIVKVEKTYPGRGCIVGEALTNPYHIVQTGKISRNVIFEFSTRTVNCG
ncbi:MAG: protease complex subunit PrcB family protein [Candidatus Bathyarchaeia archaeon]